jgi:hypothetical protein
MPKIANRDAGVHMKYRLIAVGGVELKVLLLLTLL